jgi:hypothetical protein
MTELPLLERRRLEAAVLVPIIRAMQAEFGEERVNEVVGKTIRDIARAQGAAEREHHAIDTVSAVAERTTNGVLREGSLIVDVVEQDGERFGFNVTRCKFVEMYEEMGAPTSVRCSPVAAISPTSKASRPASISTAPRRACRAHRSAISATPRALPPILLRPEKRSY